MRRSGCGLEKNLVLSCLELFVTARSWPGRYTGDTQNLKTFPASKPSGTSTKPQQQKTAAAAPQKKATPPVEEKGKTLQEGEGEMEAMTTATEEMSLSDKMYAL